MKNSLKLSLWILTTVIAVPLPAHAVTAAQSKAEKEYRFKGFIKQYKEAKALYKQREAEGAPTAELEKYKREMKIARRKAIAIFGALAFAAAVAATVTYFALRAKGKAKEAEKLGKGTPEYEAALEGKEEEEKEPAPAKEMEPALPPEKTEAELKEEEARRKTEEKTERTAGKKRQRAQDRKALTDDPNSLIASIIKGDSDTFNRYLDIATPEQINRHSKEGVTALHIAAMGKGAKATEMVTKLLNKGAEIDAQNNRNYTPLMFAIIHENNETFHSLLRKGANINAQTGKGSTPLFFTVTYNRPAMFDALLDRGADTKVTVYGYPIEKWGLLNAHVLNANWLVNAARKLGASESQIRSFNNPAVRKTMQKKLHKKQGSRSFLPY